MLCPHHQPQTPSFRRDEILLVRATLTNHLLVETYAVATSVTNHKHCLFVRTRYFSSASPTAIIPTGVGTADRLSASKTSAILNLLQGRAIMLCPHHQPQTPSSRRDEILLVRTTSPTDHLLVNTRAVAPSVTDYKHRLFGGTKYFSSAPPSPTIFS